MELDNRQSYEIQLENCFLVYLKAPQIEMNPHDNDNKYDDQDDCSDVADVGKDDDYDDNENSRTTLRRDPNNDTDMMTMWIRLIKMVWWVWASNSRVLRVPT